MDPGAELQKIMMDETFVNWVVQAASGVNIRSLATGIVTHTVAPAALAGGAVW
ncbi:MAG TPA: hypothetical protein VME43_18790 [Bryobacteraceae bacterium]|nr:hypothetical protein [Bryobacteraceae bacterium]